MSMCPYINKFIVETNTILYYFIEIGCLNIVALKHGYITFHEAYSNFSGFQHTEKMRVATFQSAISLLDRG